MKRYDPVDCDDLGYQTLDFMDEEEDGDWVSYEEKLKRASAMCKQLGWS